MPCVKKRVFNTKHINHYRWFDGIEIINFLKINVSLKESCIIYQPRVWAFNTGITESGISLKW